MRNEPNLRVDMYRLRKGFLASSTNDGNNGVFQIPFGLHTLNVVCADGLEPGPGFGWEHVSVTVLGQARTPTWDEMKYVKEQFWKDDETVVQIHPPLDKEVNFHPHCLHLWRKIGLDFPLPDPRTIAPVPEVSP